jgi:hypothetical protein
MPPQNIQPEGINPGTPQTPERPLNPPTFGEVLAGQNVEKQNEVAVPTDAKKEISPTVVLPPQTQATPAVGTQNIEQIPATSVLSPSTPKELVEKFQIIEGMADDPFAEQEAFKKAQSEYLASLGENIDKAA